MRPFRRQQQLENISHNAMHITKTTIVILFYLGLIWFFLPVPTCSLYFPGS